METTTLIDQLANAIGSADIGAPWTVNDYPNATTTERYRKLAVAALKVIELRHRPVIVLAAECGISPDMALRSIDLIVLSERQPEPPLEFKISAADLVPKMSPVFEIPREEWRRGFPRR